VAEVFVADEQEAVPVDLEGIARLTRFVVEQERLPDDVEVSVLFVDEPTIAKLNERFLDRSGPTDVLAFAVDEWVADDDDDEDEEAEEPPYLLGDVVVCPAVAARNARAHATPIAEELELLVVHGLLHLLGMDHEDDDEAERMERREDELLRRFRGLA
jgi:probable rRNA maturation factor